MNHRCFVSIHCSLNNECVSCRLCVASFSECLGGMGKDSICSVCGMHAYMHIVLFYVVFVEGACHVLCSSKICLSCGTAE